MSSYTFKINLPTNYSFKIICIIYIYKEDLALKKTP